MAANNPLSAGRRLDSWKEIAAFFGRDERTVNRWEKEQGLPVHRLPGTKGRVYAFTDELSAWLAAPRNSTAAGPVPESSASLPVNISGLTVSSPQPIAVDSDPREAPAESGVKVPKDQAPHRGVPIRFIAAAVLGVCAIALVVFPPRANRSPKTAENAIVSPRQTSAGGAVLASTPAHDPEAEQLYLKGRYYWNKRTPEDLSKALDYFTQAVVHDPNYAQAYVGLADCYNLMREYTLMPSSEAYQRALAAARKAVELDNQSSEAHASLAFASFFGMWDIATGEREFRRAIDLNPNNATSHQWYANALLALHRYPEALVEIDRAQALDPSSSAILADKGNILEISGRLDEGLTLLKQMEKRDPAFRSPHVYLNYIYLEKHEYPSFLAELRKDALLVHDKSALAIATAAEKGFASGGPRGMFEAMLKVQERLYAEQSFSATAVAMTAASLGNNPEALHYLQAAYEQRDSALLFVETDRQFKSLYNEPAYRDLLARMNLPPQDSPSTQSARQVQ
jgi:tetratricopeptide (TPR) repeat protein